MKKRILFALLAAILLVGCSVNKPEETTPVPAVTQEQIVLPELYGGVHYMEQLTLGAVREYPLSDTCQGFLPVEDGLVLIFPGEETTQLMKISGKNATIHARVEVDAVIDLDASHVAATAQGVTYYDGKENTLVLLNERLETIARISCPEAVREHAVLSAKGDRLFYTTENEIREYDVTTGQSRLLKSHTVASQKLLGSCFDGQILLCRVEELDGDEVTLFLSSKNGETMTKDRSYTDIVTLDDMYFYQRWEGTVRERLFGTRTGQVQALNLGMEDVQVHPCLAQNSAVVTKSVPGLGMELMYADLSDGKITAKVILVGVADVFAVHADDVGVWLLGGEESASVLYCWDPSVSALEDEAVYVGKRYTAQDPDVQTLSALQNAAKELSDNKRVQISIWKEAVAVTGDYSMEAAFHTEAVTRGLDSLSMALNKFPEDFFAILGNGTGSGELHIALVRGIDGGHEGVQFWHDGGAWIALVNGGSVEHLFYRELSHVLDTFIISRSRAYDNWETLNPEGFAYDLSYEVYESRTESTYLEGESRAFADSLSMTYPREDRAAILAYAMGDGNKAYFESDIMQAKLKTVCKGIRQAFGWENVKTPFPWEKYLK